MWREGSRQVNLARVLAGVEIVALEDRAARDVGELLRGNGTADIVDAHVAQLVDAERSVLTSDVADIEALLGARNVEARAVGL